MRLLVMLIGVVLVLGTVAAADPMPAAGPVVGAVEGVEGVDDDLLVVLGVDAVASPPRPQEFAAVVAPRHRALTPPIVPPPEA